MAVPSPGAWLVRHGAKVFAWKGFVECMIDEADHKPIVVALAKLLRFNGVHCALSRTVYPVQHECAYHVSAPVRLPSLDILGPLDKVGWVADWTGLLRLVGYYYV